MDTAVKNPAVADLSFKVEGMTCASCVARVERALKAVPGFQRLDEGVLGGGGTHAINGGVISAGFDAAFVLAGLGQYDSDVVVTLELSVQFLNLAEATESLVFEAAVARSSRTFCFVHGILKDSGQASPTVLARASGMVAPGTGRRRTL